MPRKKSGLVERRRLALISAMAEKEMSIKALADLVGTTDEERKVEYRKLQSSRRTKKSRLVGLEDAQKYSPHLGVPVARLLAGELTKKEREASGGEVLDAVASEAQSSRTAQLEDRKQLWKERRKALKKALGKRPAAQLRRELAAAGKRWSLNQVNAYLSGASFANREFLTDVAAILNRNPADLWIRETPFEDLGRRKVREPGPPEPAAPPPAVADPAVGVSVSIVSEGLGLSIADEVKFDVKKRRFAGNTVEVVQSEAGFRLVVSIPLGDAANRALLGLVTQ